MYEVNRVDQIIDQLGLRQINDILVLNVVADEILESNPKLVDDYRLGKEKAFNSIVGQAMAKTKGKANPTKLSEIIRSKLCILKPTT